MALTQQQIQAMDKVAGVAKKAPAQQDNPLLDVIPPAMGTLGSIGGFLGGAAIPGADLTGAPEVAGAVALGAGGQSLGEFVKEMFEGKKADPGQIASQGAQGGLFGLVPGGAEDNLAIKLLSRFGLGFLSGGGSQLIDDMSKGKKIDSNEALNILLTGGITGTGSTILPGAIGKLSKFAFGDSTKLQTELARSFVSAEHAQDPAVLKNIDFGSWNNTVKMLRDEMQSTYQPLQKALSSQTAKLGDFYRTIEEGLNKTSLHQDIIDRNLSEMVKQIGRQSEGELGNLAQEYNRLDSMVRKYPMSRGVAGAAARNAFSAKQKLLDKMFSMDVPMNVLNDAKKALGESGIYNDAQGAYFAAKKFIEDNAQGTDVKGINKTYNNLKDAADQVAKRFGNATRDIQTGEPYSWTMRAGMTSALSILPALFGITGQAQKTLISAVPLAVYFARQHLMQNPATAEPYIKSIGASEKVIPPLVDQLVKRLSPIISGLFKNQGQPDAGNPLDAGGGQ